MYRRLASAGAWCRAHPESLATAAFYLPAAITLLWVLVVTTSALGVTTNADGLWVASFAHDLLSGAPMHGWQMSALTLYFPELASLLTWQLLGLDLNTTFLLHGVLSWLLIAIATAWGLRLCGARWATALRASGATLLFYVVAHRGGAVTSTLIGPFSHGGACLCAFLGMTFIAHGLERGFSRVGSLFAVAWLGLTLASNRGVLGQFVAPTVALAVVFWVFGWAPRKRLAWALGILGAGTLMGFGMTLLIRASVGIGSVPLGLDLSWAASTITLRDFLSDMSRLAVERPLVIGSVAISLVLIGLRVGSGCARRFRASGANPSDGNGVAEWWLCCSVLAIALAAFGVLIATHWWAGMATARYVLPILMLPPAVAVMAFAPRLPRLSSLYRHGLELIALAVGVVIVAATPPAPFTARRPFAVRDLAEMDAGNYTAGQACLDHLITRERLHAGYANYWYSRPATMLGRTGTTVVELDGQFNPRRWLNNAYWYTRGYWPVTNAVPRYDFVIVSGLDSGWVFNRFGEPRVRSKCFYLETWVYDRPSDIEFRNFIRSEMATKTGDRTGWWESADLPRARDNPTEPVTIGGNGLLLHFERVAADLIEIVSPTRQPVTLSYQSMGVELAAQTIQFPADFHRVAPLPANVLQGFDTLVIRAEAGVLSKVSSVALMTDPQIATSPNRTSSLSEALLESGN